MENSLTLPEKQIKQLGHRTPEAFIQQRRGAGNRTFSYVDVGYVTAKLNQIFGHVWSFEVAREGQVGKHIWVLGRLKVMLENGTVLTKEQYGSANIKCLKDTDIPVSVGDDFKSAASDALKKCSSMLGLASDVYAPKVWQTTDALKKKLGEELDAQATQ